MQLKLECVRIGNETTQTNAVEIIETDSGETVGYIVATPEGLHLTSDWLAAVVEFTDFLPRQADIFLHKGMKRMQLHPKAVNIDTGLPEQALPATA